jgi:Uma2 family endonuclease
MGLALKNREVTFTYKDYLTWNDPAERWELIDGIAYDMSPAPWTEHQRVSGDLEYAIRQFLKGKPCEVFHAPFDVRFPDQPDDHDEDVDTVVQPDVLVVCDPTKIDQKGVRGAPDWIIEILSPRTTKKDWNEKFNLYEKNRVREYWLVDTSAQLVHQYRLNESNKYELIKICEKTDQAVSSVLEGFSVSLTEIFRNYLR